LPAGRVRFRVNNAADSTVPCSLSGICMLPGVCRHPCVSREGGCYCRLSWLSGCIAHPP
jgi:hypothetical protein